MNYKVFKKLLDERCWINCLIFGCLFLMIWCKTPSMQVPVPFPEGMTAFINEVVFGLCMSVIAGIILYILTSLVPKAEEIEPILEIIIKRLRYAKDTLGYSLRSIGNVSCIEHITPEAFVDGFIGGTKLPSGRRILKANLKYIREELLDYVDFTLQYIYSRTDCLDKENAEGVRSIMEKILELRTVIDELFAPYERKETDVDSTEVIFVGEEQLTRIAKGLIELYEQIQNMHERIGLLVEEKP